MIYGERINLRLMKEKELEEYVKKTEEVFNFGDYWISEPPSLNKLKNDFNKEGFWMKNGWKQLLVVDKNDKMIGEIFCFKPTWYLDALEIGYRIFSPEDRGKGYTTEALEIFTDYLFRIEKVNRLQLGLAEGNIGSEKAAEKVGFKFEGIFRKAFFVNGKYHNMKYFSILREENNGR